jgi:hypothetical protein
MLSLRLFIGTAIILGGCVHPPGASNYQRVAVTSWETGRVPTFRTEYSAPGYFTLSPREVVMTYGDRCRGTYNCTYFADGDAYYLLQDYGVIPGLSIPTRAVVIVDGRTGKLIKGQ